MTQKTKKAGILFSILTGVATLSFAFMMLSMFSALPVGLGIMCAVWLAIVIEALIYFGKGGRKEDSKFFKAFAWTFLLSFTFREIFVIITPLPALGGTVLSKTIGEAAVFMLWLISYSCFLLLAFSENLGVRKSANLTVVAVVSTVIITLVELFMYNFNFSCIFEGITTVFGIIVYYEIFKAKYEDKDARGAV